MKINKFEDIKAWQEARIFVRSIYDCSNRNREFSRDLRFKSQVTSSATSIMSNIAEGFSRRSNKEFIQFLFIAKGSIAESQSQLYTSLDLKYISQEEFESFYRQLDKIARLISKFISYLRGTRQTQQTQRTQRTQ